MKLVAAQELRYDAKNYNPGDEFECDDTHGALLKAIGKATDAAKKSTTKKQQEEPPPPPMPTTDPVTQLTDEVEQRPRRRYNRRDMQAEE